MTEIRKRRKVLFPGNRKLVLRVIEENSGITLKQVRKKLKKIHEDWHPTKYVLIRHVLGLCQTKHVIVKPDGVRNGLKKILSDHVRNKSTDEEERFLNLAKKARCYSVNEQTK